MVKRFSLLLAAAFLSGCGFHWQGDRASSTFLLEGFDENNPLVIELQRAMPVNGAPLTLIRLEKEQWQQRVAAIDDTVKVAEVEWQYQVWYQLTPIEAALPQADQTVKVSADYGYQSTQLLASDAEQQLMRRELRAQAAQQILQRAEQWQLIHIP